MCPNRNPTRTSRPPRGRFETARPAGVRHGATAPNRGVPPPENGSESTEERVPRRAESAEASPTDVSDAAEVPRTRVYDAAAALRERGLAERERASPTEFHPVSAETATRRAQREPNDPTVELSTALGALEPGRRDSRGAVSGRRPRRRRRVHRAVPGHRTPRERDRSRCRAVRVAVDRRRHPRRATAGRRRPTHPRECAPDRRRVPPHRP
ncbi:helix-turn-helix domain-containing protein [Halobaculum sp. MBLA0143]|uniref:helix-turn-helix domain-containing protein n=1 Tax=Halobaculum sp. MBLA0143 TaxID=3079933 RepID=UPI0035236863